MSYTPLAEAVSVTHDTFPFAFLAHSHVWELRRIKPHSPNSESVRSSARRNSWILEAIALLSNQSSRINRASRSGPSAQTGFGSQFPSQRLAIPAWNNQKRRSVPRLYSLCKTQNSIILRSFRSAPNGHGYGMTKCTALARSDITISLMLTSRILATPRCPTYPFCRCSAAPLLLCLAAPLLRCSAA